MTVFQKLKIKEVSNDTASTIAHDLQWDYEYLCDSRRAAENEIVENLGEVTEENENRLMFIDARIKVYDKVFELLEKL